MLNRLISAEPSLSGKTRIHNSKRKESNHSKRKRYLAKLQNPNTCMSERLNVKVWLRKNGGYG